MSKLTKKQDAFGQAMWDHYQGKNTYEIVERDDGHISPSGGPRTYFAQFSTWPVSSRKGLRFAKGRVLDVGCGAGSRTSRDVRETERA